MTEKTKLCGFQPTGNSEDIPKPPKFKPANTDKLEDHLLPYKKEVVQKIRDEKMQLVTADEFVKLHKESLTAIRENDKLQEIRVEELKDFNSKILQAELINKSLKEELDAAKKYIEESYKADKEDNSLLDLIIEAVEKLKSDNKAMKKALTEIYLDENETIIDPVFLFHQSQRIAGRALNELGENNEI
ncbi:hypothetical protein [Lactococcus lactis]|uniref:hypothetical protein n=1 Tax=Lactococcus lactis TaxID=1358 RepID=UPI002890C617|nr:hypothetical protein [Lactococcus lactis]MDT2903342.1 hypothetical protein [Lactococcus lactis]